MAVVAIFQSLEPRIIDQIIQFARFEQSFPGFVVTGEVNHERFAVAIQQAVDTAFGEVLPRHRFATVQVIGYVRFDERYGHLQKRDVDELPNAGFRAREQSGHDAVRGKDARGVIDE